MKKLLVVLLVVLLTLTSFCFVGCGDKSNTITVCASELPHADILKNCVATILEEQGYKLEVKAVNWDMPNNSVVAGDYDANYFQHIPYLEGPNGSDKLFAACKVHYEPLGIYKCDKNAEKPTGAYSVAICNDNSNAIRALELLYAKGYISSLPVSDGRLTFSTQSTKVGDVTIVLIEENLLVPSMADYDYVCLPCNTALTGNVDQTLRVDREDDVQLVSNMANILAARVDDYANDPSYKAKIDALTNALLSQAVADYVAQKWGGAITCDATTQIDLRPGK
jgi:D-methionine transport system substrate-binding protein